MKSRAPLTGTPRLEAIFAANAATTPRVVGWRPGAAEREDQFGISLNDVSC